MAVPLMVAGALIHGAVIPTLLYLVLLFIIALVLAPLSRQRAWARDHLVDIAAMAIAMIVMIISPDYVGHTSQMPGMGGSRLDPMILFPFVVGVWVVTRLVLLRGSRHRRASALVSFALCALCFAVMAVEAWHLALIPGLVPKVRSVGWLPTNPS